METEKSEMKARERSSWARVAPGWKKHDERLALAFAPLTERLLDVAGVTAGSRVLDIASGTGEPALPAAVRVGHAGKVVGTDFVEEMLEVAREKAELRGLTNVEFKVQDGEALDVLPGAFDAVTMRFGLMFMPDPGACLVRARRALRSGGRIGLACWAAPERNPWASLPMAAVRRRANPPPPAPGAPGMFAFADPGRLQATLEGAGFSDVRIEELSLRPAEFDTGAQLFQWTCELAGPIAALFAQLDQATQEEVAREVAAEIERRTSVPGRAVLDGVTWVASGRA